MDPIIEFGDLLRDFSQGPPQAMTSATIIVFEQQPRWTPELQRQFGDVDVRVRGCTTTADVARVIASLQQARSSVDSADFPSLPTIRSTQQDRFSGTLVLLDLASGPAECLQFLGRSINAAIFPPNVVIGSEQLADLEWPVRELGALDFLLGHLSGDNLAGICRRQLSSAQSRHARL